MRNATVLGVVLAVSAALSAHASLVTRTFTVTGTGYRDTRLADVPPLTPPAASYTFVFTVTLDPTVSTPLTTEVNPYPVPFTAKGIVLNSTTLPYNYRFLIDYTASSESLLFGAITPLSGFEDTATGDITGAFSATPVFVNLDYDTSTSNGAFQSSAGTVTYTTPNDIPEPVSAEILLGAVAALAFGKRMVSAAQRLAFPRCSKA